MRAPSIWRRILMVSVATLLFLVSGTLAWAAASDYQHYDLAPFGTRVAGHDVAGLTRDQVRAVIESEVVVPVQKPLRVLLLGQPYTLPAEGLVSVNVDEMLAQVFDPAAESAIDERVISDVRNPAPLLDVSPVYAVNTARVAAWVAGFARTVADRPYVNASVSVTGNKPRFTHARVGYSLNQQTAVQRISQAVVSTRRTIDLPVKVLQPKIPDAKLSKLIIVDKSERRLYLYRNMKLDRSFRVAVGMAHYPTPLGSFKIVQKRYRPTWVNPGSAWAKSMPAYIGPGPGNPLGTRAMNLSAPGIRIHGTNKISSIGTAASHGCIRMVRRDVEWLYDRVTVGTPVYVVR